MKRIYIQIVSLLLVTVLIGSSYVSAASVTETTEVNFRAMGQGDVVQNNLDEGEVSNFDTWDPVPQGVWFGGWPKESILRLDEVPDDDFSIALAQVALFGSDLIMSGAAKTLIRLPIRTTDDPWDHALLNVYEISRATNWSFIRMITQNKAGPPDPFKLNDMRINFTAGPHELMFWSQEIEPDDISPTDDDDHFTRSNRTFCFVDAPIHPGRYYLFVTYVWYDSDKYVDIYLQPDSLDSGGSWNRSSLAVYNEQAPDLYSLVNQNFNISMGYSFDFVHGFGNSAYGLNHWFDAEDRIEFYSYVDPDQIDTSHYLTFMLPFRSSTDNVTWSVTIYAINFGEGDHRTLFSIDDYVANDFLLFSMEDDLANNITAFNFDGWFKVICTVKNDTRLWLPLWDIPFNETTSINETFFGESDDLNWKEFFYTWDSDWRYNPLQFLQYEKASYQVYNYHWMVQHSIQFNPYRWDKVGPAAAGTENLESTEEMTFGQKIFYGIGSVFIKVGNWIAPIHPGYGYDLRLTGLAAQMVAQYADFPGVLGWAYDKLMIVRDALVQVGQWLWRVGQAIRGALEFVWDLLQVVLAIGIVILAVVLLFTPIYFTFKGGMAIRKAVLGDIEGAAAEITGAVQTSQKMVRKLNPRG